MAHDYVKLGFKAGLEIHQQLDTGKLFSHAPSYLRKDEPDYVIKRKLHAVAGESGEIDVAVKHEAELDKVFEYEGYNDTVSLVELDEEPPRPINEDALDVALQIALLLNCEIYGVSQVMRKTVIDGSNTTGFQRTVLIAHDGFVETSFGNVGIESIALEEDSARIIKREKNSVRFRLDRLGIPLVEITTAPDMKNPEQVRECALKIGGILRACRVKRGIGTIRQDVNVSVKGHDRVEIKGFQDAKMFVKAIDLEVERQLKEIEDIKNNIKLRNNDKRLSKNKSHNSSRLEVVDSKKIILVSGAVRNALPSGESEYLRPLPGKARMYPETDLELLKIDRHRINRLKKDLPRLKEDIRAELKKKGLTDELISLVLAGNLDEFNILMQVYDRDANLVAKMITLWRKEFARKIGKSVSMVRDELNERVLEKILLNVRKKHLEKRDVKDVMFKVLEGVSVESAVKSAGEKVEDDEVESEVRRIVKEKPGLRANAYMGLLMKNERLKGKLDAKKTMEIIKRIIGDYYENI